MSSAKNIKILYVEDSPADTEFLQTAFRRTAPEIDLLVVDSGAKAIAKLEQGIEEGALPDLILLDLKMPGMDGHEVLSSIKNNPHMRHVPVIILTSSRLEEDIMRAYEVGANCYLPKPDDAIGYAAIAAELRRFWLETTLLPPGRPA